MVTIRPFPGENKKTEHHLSTTVTLDKGDCYIHVALTELM
jgi:hypothetical protein